MSTGEATHVAAADSAVNLEVSIEEAIQRAKRAYALRNFEQAVEHYASALELKSKEYGDASPECVDLYFAYGKALLENAISQNSVLGKEETSAALEGDVENTASGSTGNASGARIHFGEDAVLGEENDDSLAPGEVDREEQTIDLFAEAAKVELEAQHDGENEGSGDDDEDDAEPEDDFNAAWEILEVARSLYETQKEAGDETKLKLADTYIALGDVSLETEKLEQAARDYTAAVALKSELLSLSSRQIAEVHYKLCIVYDMSPGRLAHAIEHAQKAEASVRARLNELTTRLQSTPTEGTDPKGKRRAVSSAFGTDASMDDMTRSQLESEIKELEGLLEDVSLKIDELKSSPDTVEGSAPDLVAQELDRDLNGPAASKLKQGTVNDLTYMVVKKKKQAPETAGDKRKADEGAAGSPEKRAKV